MCWKKGEAGQTCYYCGEDLEGADYKMLLGSRACEACVEETEVAEGEFGTEPDEDDYNVFPETYHEQEI